MLILRDYDAMHYKAFPSTLFEAAQQWFSSLFPSSVRSFANLIDKLLNHFTASQADRKLIRNHAS